MSEPLVELLEAELRVGSHPFRFLAPKDLARVAAASRAFHGGFDYGKVRGLVATYVSDVCEALDLQRSARTDHGEPWWSSGQQKGAKFPTSKAHISAVFHSFWLILGRAIISRNGLEA